MAAVELASNTPPPRLQIYKQQQSNMAVQGTTERRLFNGVQVGARAQGGLGTGRGRCSLAHCAPPDVHMGLTGAGPVLLLPVLQGDKSNQGELFGLQNLLAFNPGARQGGGDGDLPGGGVEGAWLHA